MSENANYQEMDKDGQLDKRSFRANFKAIFESETTFGSAKLGRMDMLDAVHDIIREYIAKGCKTSYIHKQLMKAGYTGSRKELTEWLAENGLRSKRTPRENTPEIEENIVEKKESNETSEDAQKVNTSPGKATLSGTVPLRTAHPGNRQPAE